MLLSIVSPEATAHAAAVQLLAPINFSPSSACGGGGLVLPPLGDEVISQDTRHTTAKQHAP